ncbi:hypothetical protein N2604_06695 [Bradyrhizobium sp. CB1015]|nr:hypothetical protein [Bradyrhizobium sp. CB1015]UWU93605.1 hypothetical protein N2604_06695 [Bradyrhizobium sp. CB1015]
MTVTTIKTDVSAVKELLRSDKEFLKPLIRRKTLEAEMTETLGAENGDQRGKACDLAPKFYPILSSLRLLDLPGWVVAATGAGGGAFGIAQRQIPARVTAEGELGGRFPSCECGRASLYNKTQERPQNRFSRGSLSISSLVWSPSLRSWNGREG